MLLILMLNGGGRSLEAVRQITSDQGLRELLRQGLCGEEFTGYTLDMYATGIKAEKKSAWM
jgi:hypothetical protein